MTGKIHRPVEGNGLGIVLTHGAGGNIEAPLLVKLAEALASSGWWVLRYNLPFRQLRTSGPPLPGGAAQDREGLRSAVGELREVVGQHIFMGGHSYGGRQASMLAAEAPELVEGLLLLSYPLHPPKKPDQLRTAHFSQIRTPTLFVSGSKDEFGSVAEITNAVRLIPAKTEVQIVEGAGHDLMKGAFDLPRRFVSAFTELIKPS